MYYDIATSRARKIFKRLLGHTNHFLITQLIGLDYIKNNDVTLPVEFSTSWNPRNKISSVERSRDFAIKAALSWAIDALDAYLSLCHQKPTLYQNKEISDLAGGAKQSVLKKFIVLQKYVQTAPPIHYEKFCALTELAISWRNKMVHYNAENTIDSDTRRILKTTAAYFSEKFRGLDIDKLLFNFDNDKTPHFKEITSIISGIHKFVEASDSFLLSKLNKKIHFIDCYIYHLKLGTEDITKLRNKIGLLYNLPNSRRMNSLKQIIMNYGFKLTENVTTINDGLVEKISSLNFEDTMNFLQHMDLQSKMDYLIE